MTRLGLSTALALAIATPAVAADLPSKAAPPVYVPPPVPVFSWTGFYAGIQAGYAFGKDNVSAVSVGRPTIVSGGGGGGGGGGSTVVDAAAAAPTIVPGKITAGSITTDPEGVVGGGHVGYNWSTNQILGGFLGPAGVIGIEGDAEGLDNSRTVFYAGSSAHLRSELQGSIRGRLGFAFDRLLVYGTGGAAFGDFKSTYSSGVLSTGFDTTRVGWTAGGGLEYAFTSNWSVRAEYRYSDFGSVSNTIVAPFPTISYIGIRQHETNQRVEGGISYLFTTPAAAPVVAKY